MVFVGAYEAFVQQGHGFNRLMGTSAGAITATLLAAGYTSDEMMEALREKEGDKSVFEGFMAFPKPFTKEELSKSATQTFLEGIRLRFVPNRIESWVRKKLVLSLAKGKSRHLLALIERGGWFGADPFVTWLTDKLNSGQWQGSPRQFGDMTLKQFFEATQVELSLIASDTDDHGILVLNHRTAPQCPVKWAVRMSMSLPLVWDEVSWKSDWGRYRGRDISSHVIVDGGLISNFPIELLISDHHEITQAMGPQPAHKRVIGMLIDETLEVPMPKGILTDIAKKAKELKTVKRLRQLVNTATGAHDKMVIEDYDHLVVRLPAKGYETTEFNMTDERREALIDAGRAAMHSYLETQWPSLDHISPMSEAAAMPEATAMPEAAMPEAAAIPEAPAMPEAAMPEAAPRSAPPTPAEILPSEHLESIPAAMSHADRIAKNIFR